jgi:hypothetical protein
MTRLTISHKVYLQIIQGLTRSGPLNYIVNSMDEFQILIDPVNHVILGRDTNGVFYIGEVTNG